MSRRLMKAPCAMISERLNDSSRKACATRRVKSVNGSLV